MKRRITSISLLCVLFVALTGCNKDEASYTTDQVNERLQDGNWRLTHLYESEQNQASGFQNYIFTFNSSYVVNARNNTTTVTGNWSTKQDGNGVRLDLQFSYGSLFEKLNEDWLVIRLKNKLIEMQHVNSGNGTTDILRFEKY